MDEPANGSNRGVIVFLIALAALLVFTLIATLYIRGQKRQNLALPSVSATFDTIASLEGQKVTLDGKLYISGTMAVSSECDCYSGFISCSNLQLVPGDSTSPTGLNVYMQLQQTKDTARIKPDSFYFPTSALSDFVLFTHESQPLRYADRIQVVGFVDTVSNGFGITYVKICPLTLEPTP